MTPYYAWLWLAAFFRWSETAICEMSRGRDGNVDFHDWQDSEAFSPLHFTDHKCVRCGKEFTL